MRIDVEDTFATRGPPVTDDELLSIERANSVATPSALVELWRLVGHGRFRRRHFLLEDGFGEAVHQLLPVRTTTFPPTHPDGKAVVMPAQPVWFSRFIDQRLISRRLFPFALGATGEVFCIDPLDDSVQYVPVDSAQHRVRRVASGLEAFLQMLTKRAQ